MFGNPQQASITTSFQPGGMFPQAYTRQAGNLASALLAPTRQQAMVGQASPGVSMMSPFAQWRTGVGMGQQQAQATMAPIQIQQEHGWQNAGFNLAGQQARNQEGLGWARMGLEQLQNSIQNRNNNQSNLLALLQGAQGWWQ